jgi:hypothetical protein
MLNDSLALYVFKYVHSIDHSGRQVSIAIHHRHVIIVYIYLPEDLALNKYIAQLLMTPNDGAK